MKRVAPLLSILGLLGSSLLVPRTASADESKRGPFYVQVQPLGVDVGFAGSGGAGPSSTDAFYALGIDAGYHFSGRHDGFVVGLSQRFSFGPNTAGSTVARVGYDFAFGLDAQELVVAPYAFGGARYVFDGGDPAGYFGFGVEGRYFLLAKNAAATAAGSAAKAKSAATGGGSALSGLYLVVKPFELGFATGTPSMTTLTFQAGVGYSF